MARGKTFDPVVKGWRLKTDIKVLNKFLRIVTSVLVLMSRGNIESYCK